MTAKSSSSKFYLTAYILIRLCQTYHFEEKLQDSNPHLFDLQKLVKQGTAMWGGMSGGSSETTDLFQIPYPAQQNWNTYTT